MADLLIIQGISIDFEGEVWYIIIYHTEALYDEKRDDYCQKLEETIKTASY